MADGYLTIGTRLETKEFEKEIKRLNKELDDYKNQEIKIKTKIEKTNESLKPYEEEKARIQQETDKELETAKTDEQANFILQEEEKVLESLKQKYADKIKLQQDLNAELEKNKEIQAQIENQMNNTKQISPNQGFNFNPEGVKQLGAGLNNIIKKTIRWGLAVFGVRSAYSMIRQAMSSLSQQNETLKADMEYIRFAMAQALAPVVEWLVSLAYKLLNAFNQVVYSLFKVNLFAKASVANFKKARKELAGFDEINRLNDTGEGGTPSQELGKVRDIDFGTLTNEFVLWLDDLMKKISNWFESYDWVELGRKIYDGIRSFFDGDGFGLIVEDISRLLGNITGALAGIALGLLNGLMNDMIGYFKDYVDKWQENGAGLGQALVLGIIEGLFEFPRIIGEWIREHILIPFIDGFCKAFGIDFNSKVMIEKGQQINEGLKEGLKGIWEKVKSIFEDLKTKIANVFTSIRDKARSIFSNVANWVSSNIINPIVDKINYLKDRISSITDGIRSGIYGVINKIIDGLNKLIKGMNKLSFDAPDWVPVIGGKKWGINIPTIPQLESGGIVKAPKGVLMGSYIAGEKNRSEAVLPLENEATMRRLGQEIGQYITLTLNLTNTLDGRILNRRLEEIRNNATFSRNGV